VTTDTVTLAPYQVLWLRRAGNDVHDAL
jgi:hypothetical protein